MKANGGMLVIDDFGRQHLDAADLLNRWIVPLEQRHRLPVPPERRAVRGPLRRQDRLLHQPRPADLGDEAFFRRIRYKVEVPGPTEGALHGDLRGRVRSATASSSAKPAAQYMLYGVLHQAGPPDAWLPSPRPHGLHHRRRPLRGRTGNLTTEAIDEACHSVLRLAGSASRRNALSRGDGRSTPRAPPRRVPAAALAPESSGVAAARRGSHDTDGDDLPCATPASPG